MFHDSIQPPTNPHTTASASCAGSSCVTHSIEMLRAARRRLPVARERLVPLAPARWMPWPVSGLIRWCMTSRRIAAHQLAEAVGCDEMEIHRLQAVGLGSPCVLVAALRVLHADEPLQMHDVLAVARAIKVDDTLPLVFTGQAHQLVDEVLRRIRSDVLAPIGATAVEAGEQSRPRVTPNYDGRGREVPLESPYALSPKGVVA